MQIIDRISPRIKYENTSSQTHMAIKNENVKQEVQPNVDLPDFQAQDICDILKVSKNSLSSRTVARRIRKNLKKVSYEGLKHVLKQLKKLQVVSECDGGKFKYEKEIPEKFSELL